MCPFVKSSYRMDSVFSFSAVCILCSVRSDSAHTDLCIYRFVVPLGGSLCISFFSTYPVFINATTFDPASYFIALFSQVAGCRIDRANAAIFTGLTFCHCPRYILNLRRCMPAAIIQNRSQRIKPRCFCQVHVYLQIGLSGLIQICALIGFFPIFAPANYSAQSLFR